jgi:hypothetical protein
VTSSGKKTEKEAGHGEVSLIGLQPVRRVRGKHVSLAETKRFGKWVIL